MNGKHANSFKPTLSHINEILLGLTLINPNHGDQLIGYRIRLVHSHRTGGRMDSVTEGRLFTVIVFVAVAVHVPTVTVTVYVPDVDTIIDGVAAPVLHKYVPPPVAVNVAVSPEHIIPSFGIPEFSDIVMSAWQAGGISMSGNPETPCIKNGDSIPPVPSTTR